MFLVYVLASRRNGTLYVGVTANLANRVWQHRHGLAAGFTSEYRVHRLVWHALHDSPYAANTREKQIKRWNRAWKVRIIEAMNPYWNDLSATPI